MNEEIESTMKGVKTGSLLTRVEGVLAKEEQRVDPAARHVDSNIDQDSALRNDLMRKYQSSDPITKRDAYEELRKRGWL